MGKDLAELYDRHLAGMARLGQTVGPNPYRQEGSVHWKAVHGEAA
jgi:hypothetical protein